MNIIANILTFIFIVAIGLFALAMVGKGLMLGSSVAGG